MSLDCLLRIPSFELCAAFLFLDFLFTVSDSGSLVLVLHVHVWLLDFLSRISEFTLQVCEFMVCGFGVGCPV